MHPSIGLAVRAPLLPLLVRGDPALWLAVAALGALGLVMAYSSSLDAAPHAAVTPQAARHALLGAAGVAAMLVAARIDYRLLQRAGALAYLGAGALLLVVVVAGESEYGARRWLPVGGATVQPAEAAKLALVLALASYAAVRPPRAAALAVTAALLALLAAPVVLQPDTGTAVVLVAAWAVVVVAWGAHWRALGVLFGVVLAAGPLAFALVVPDYQRERLAVFLDPARDPLGSGFSLRQVEAALGAGGLTGDGLFGGAESHLAGVTARSSDFVFALVGEELGVLGGLAVIALFALVAWRGLEASRRAPDAFGRLLAAGLTALILSQALLNVAVNLRLFPATGLPLPFVSAGGSALLVMFVAAGLLQSVHARRLPTRGGLHASGRWDEDG
jgi:rod shape determining protein RodA